MIVKILLLILITCLLFVCCKQNNNSTYAQTNMLEKNTIQFSPTPVNSNSSQNEDDKSHVAITVSIPNVQLIHNDNPKLGEHYKPFWIEDDEQSDNGFEPFCVEAKVKGKIERRCGYQDRKGKILIRPIFYKTFIFSEDLAGVCPKIEQICGYINTKGNFTIKPNYQYAGKFSEGVGLVTVEPKEPSDYEKIGYINKQGKYIIKPQYTDGEPFRDGIAKVRLRNLSFCINKKNEEVLCPDR